MLGRADEAGNVEAGERAGPGVKVAKENPEGVPVKFDDGELGKK
jgi:hypothetical protein